MNSRIEKLITNAKQRTSGKQKIYKRRNLYEIMREKRLASENVAQSKVHDLDLQMVIANVKLKVATNRGTIDQYKIDEFKKTLNQRFEQFQRTGEIEQDVKVVESVERESENESEQIKEIELPYNLKKAFKEIEGTESEFSKMLQKLERK